MTNWNDGIIAEFHGNNGKVGGPIRGRTPAPPDDDRRQVRPAARRADEVLRPKDGTRYVIASKGGAPTNPDWYHNLVAHPAGAR